ncbi:N-acetylglucosamine kinase [Liquorilactobacillus vini]|uniref:N-acetylglucosamine kinase n=1 Tax=Liquorilactobacillus vini TaxID=238015 RepID=UPI00029ACC1E|nr:BadF/BadG/BcrA/BcrD ATPase family protein [Liquorilactobacillus vini]
MKYRIGIDSGGTKIKASAWNEQHKCLLNVTSGPGNILLNQNQTLKNLSSVITQIKHKLDPAECTQILIGIAGIETSGNAAQITADFNQTFGIPTNVINDALLALINGLEGQDGTLIISGTGSVIYGRQGKKIYRVGGWGNLLGDQGSAYKIVENFFKIALNDFDRGKTNRSQIQSDLLNIFAVDSMTAAVRKYYQLKRPEIASLAVKVAQKATQKHTGAIKAILNQANLLALQAETMFNNFEKSYPKKVALAGSVLTNNQLFKKRISSVLLEKHPDLKFLIAGGDNSRAVIFWNAKGSM